MSAFGVPPLRCYKDQALGKSDGDMGGLRKPNRGAFAGTAAACAVVLLTLAACSSCPFSWGSSTPASAPPPAGGSPPTGFRQRMSNLFFGSSSSAVGDASASAVPNVTGVDPTEDCPGVDVRAGASTIQLNTPGQDATAVTVKYQITIARTARECSVRGTNLTVKVGVLGRIILGPAGTPGQLDIPLRLALVQEGPEPKTVWTKFYKIPVVIPPGQSNTPFMHVEEDLTVPIPRRVELDAYQIYVGFDQAAVAPPPKPTKKKSRVRASR